MVFQEELDIIKGVKVQRHNGVKAQIRKNSPPGRGGGWVEEKLRNREIKKY